LKIIELPKSDQLGMAAGDLAAWVSYFKHWREQAMMNKITHPPVQLDHGVSEPRHIRAMPWLGDI